MDSYLEANLTFATDDTNAALAAWEALNRVALGIAFDGVHVELSLDRIRDTDEEDDDQAADEAAGGEMPY